MCQKTRSHKKRPAGGPLIRCMHDALVDPTSNVPNPKNEWHKHPKEQLDLYGMIVMETGFRRAIVISKRSGMIVKGHGLNLTAIARGWPVVPVEYQDYDNEEQELADMLADNKLAQLAGTDESKLRALLSGLDGKIDLQIAGLTMQEIEDMKVTPPDGEAQFPITAKLHERYDYVVVFTTNETDFQHLQNLAGVRTEKSYKNSHVGIGRVVPFYRFLRSLRSHRHTLDEPGKDDDHPSPASKRRVRDLRARKPAR